jgi:energy-coupling factor transporter ATP-binding protein EcfA2
MSEQNIINPIISWAGERPLWEKYIWKVCLESGSLTPEQLDVAYNYLLIESGVVASEEALPEISLDGLVPPESQLLLPIRLKSIGGLRNVNALSGDQTIPFHEKLTLIYGRNATGKSGYGRLLSKACFSRANKKILPNLKDTESQGVGEATFTMHDGSTIKFLDNGFGNESLKRFSVFDSDCVPIYIDGSNSLQFTPGQLHIFDTVNLFIQKIEEKFNGDVSKRTITTPVPYIFQNEPISSISAFLLNINHLTTATNIEQTLSLNDKEIAKIELLSMQRDELIKLDIPRKKKELIDNCQILRKYKQEIETFLGNFGNEKITELNALIKDVVEKSTLVEKLGSSQFNDGLLKTVGSEKWKALITAAKELNDAELAVDNKLDKCMLCHQELKETEKTLFTSYWQFLLSTAEKDFQTAKHRIGQWIKSIEALKNKLTFAEDNLAVRILRIEQPTFVTEIEEKIPKLAEIIDSLVKSLTQLKEITTEGHVEIALDKIDIIIAEKTREESSLVDPRGQILAIDKELLELRHKQKASAIKEKILEYLDYLVWKNKADQISFPKHKYTSARKHFFNAILTDRYKEIFNEEVNSLDGHIGLSVNTSGRSGDTVIKLGLDFAKVNQLSEVLSEGEQKVTALADFLTEVRIDRNNCGIIFDDPVTSLDHERKSLIAKRLALESRNRQVIIFTHDIVFMSMIAEHAVENSVEFSSHWIRRLIDGTLGVIEKDSNPKLSNLESLKKDAKSSVNGIDKLGEKEKEKALGSAFDYLRSATEALIREVLLAGTIKRYDDHIRVQNIEEIPFTKELGVKIAKLHGKISELGLMHDRSNEFREKQPDIEDFSKAFKEFEEIEEKLKKARNLTRKERDERRSEIKQSSQGWLG